jgi:hypothetical protein
MYGAAGVDFVGVYEAHGGGLRYSRGDAKIQIAPGMARNRSQNLAGLIAAAPTHAPKTQSSYVGGKSYPLSTPYFFYQGNNYDLRPTNPN